MTDKQEIDRAVERIMQAADRYAFHTAAWPLRHGEVRDRKQMEKDREELIALVRAEFEERVPQGWQVVPAEPTAEMCLAGNSRIWHRMLAAAPTPQQEER